MDKNNIQLYCIDDDNTFTMEINAQNFILFNLIESNVNDKPTGDTLLMPLNNGYEMYLIGFNSVLNYHNAVIDILTNIYGNVPLPEKQRLYKRILSHVIRVKIMDNIEYVDDYDTYTIDDYKRFLMRDKIVYKIDDDIYIGGKNAMIHAIRDCVETINFNNVFDFLINMNFDIIGKKSYNIYFKDCDKILNTLFPNEWQNVRQNAIDTLKKHIIEYDINLSNVGFDDDYPPIPIEYLLE